MDGAFQNETGSIGSAARGLLLVERRFKATALAALLGDKWNVVSISGCLPEKVFDDDICQVRPEAGQRLAVSEELLALKRRVILAPVVLIATDPTELGEMAAQFIANVLNLDQARRIDLYEISETGIAAALRRVRPLDQKAIRRYRHDRRHSRLIRLALTRDQNDVMGRKDYSPEKNERTLLDAIVRLDRQQRVAAHTRRECLVLRCDDFLAYPIGLLKQGALSPGRRKQLRVVSCRTFAHQESPPAALDFATLLALAAARLGLRATEVHDQAYQLYLRGLVSWPFTTSCDLGAKGARAARDLARAKGYPLVRDDSFDAESYHPHAFAIRPLDFYQEVLGTRELQGVYSLIHECAVLSVLQPSMKKERHIVVEVDTVRGPVRFEARGEQALTHGWREVVECEFGQSGGDTEPFLPLLNAGDLLYADVMQQSSLCTTSAARLKESDVMSAFDPNHPLAPQDAVLALRNLMKDDFIRLQGDHLVPTAFGVAVARLIESKLHPKTAQDLTERSELEPDAADDPPSVANAVPRPSSTVDRAGLITVSK